MKKEACTLDLAPTASTTATLAMGDALAVSLLELRGFNKKDFAKLHPGGMLGIGIAVEIIMMHVDGAIMTGIAKSQDGPVIKTVVVNVLVML